MGHGGERKENVGEETNKKKGAGGYKKKGRQKNMKNKENKKGGARVGRGVKWKRKRGETYLIGDDVGVFLLAHRRALCVQDAAIPLKT